MFFVIDKPKFQRIIAIVRDDVTPSKQGDNAPFLRIEAKENQVTVAGSTASGTFPATVYEPGVIFLRTTLFRKMLQTFTQEKFFSLQVAQDGLHLGNVRISFERADMVLFPKPEQAPAHWPPDFPERELLTEAEPTPAVSGVLAAIKFAADKHRHQRRKDKDASPYINHPIEVADLLWTVGKIQNVKVLQAALLHDVLEDTDSTPQEIEGKFGKEVLRLVEEVTDDKSLPKPERRRLQIEHAPHLSSLAKPIKLADKISNVREMITSPPAAWSREEQIRYADWAEQVVQGLRGCNTRLEILFSSVIQEFRRNRRTR